jgi:SAM-dependent methyltransferase
MSLPHPSDSPKGVVYTRPEVVTNCLDISGFTESERILEMRALDIGCGYGQFIGKLARRVALACKGAGYDRRQCVGHLVRNLRGVEIDPRTAEHAREEVLSAVAGVYPTRSKARVWLSKVVVLGDYLSDEVDGLLGGRFDFITGNLPYVRYKHIKKLPNEPGLDDLRSRFKCFRGRSDYSIAFMEKLLGSLTESGKASVITSNAFTRADYGAKLRRKITTSRLSVDELDFSIARVFEDDVSAYASLFIIRKEAQSRNRLITLNSRDTKILARLTKLGFGSARTCSGYRKITRLSGNSPESPWSPFGPEAMRIVKRTLESHKTISESGFEVRKGPATGADEVFIRTRGGFGFSKRVRDRYLRPYERAGRKKKDEVILSVYSDGKLIKFERLPREVREYLEPHREQLQNRYIVKKGVSDWWSTIDKVDFGIAELPKVLIPDYGLECSFHKNGERSIPGHSVVYITNNNGVVLQSLIPMLNHPLIMLIRLWKAPPLRGMGLRSSSNVVKGLPLSSDNKGARLYGLSESESKCLEKEVEILFRGS